MKAYHHEADGEHMDEIPAEFAGAVETAREKLTDLVAEADEELMEKFLEGEALTQDDLEKLLGLAIAQGIFIPVFVGSRAQAAGRRGPHGRDRHRSSPSRPPTAPSRPSTAEAVPISVEGAVSLFVFKTASDPYLGRLNFVKVVSGTLTPNTELLNSRTGKKERVGHVLKMIGKETKDVDAVPAGDIAVLPKLADTATNDTLSAKGDVTFAPMPMPEPLHAVAIAATNKADEDKLGQGINRIVEEDPTLRLNRDAETHQTVLYGLGDTHIDVVMSRLKSRFNVETHLVDLRIPYRETIRKVAQAQGRHKKQTGGSGQFADCWLRVEPNPGKGYEFVDEIVGGRISKPFIVAIDKGVQETMLGGAIAGYPVVDVKVAVYDGSMHAVDSNEMAFRTAARIGFRAAAEKADPVLLEPIAHLTITVPDQYAGDVMGDMSSRRGKILGMEGAGNKQVIKASVPYAEVVSYSLQLRSITHGTGAYSLEIGEYAEVPFDLAKKIIEQHKKDQEENHCVVLHAPARREARRMSVGLSCVMRAGALCRTRTCDLLLRRQTLYPLG